MTRLFTSRLILRPIERADFGALDSWYRDPELMRYIGDGHPYGRTETEIALRRAIDDTARNGFGLMLTELKDTGEPVGRCGYMAWDVDGERLIEIGWLIATAHQGNGYATEAGRALRANGFRALGQQSLISVIQPPNTASVRVAEKLGGGYWRDWVTPGGQDVVLYRYEQELSRSQRRPESA